MSKVLLAFPSFMAELMRDVFLLVGIGLLWYGLWLYKPWVSYAVVGALVVVISLVSAIISNISIRKAPDVK